MASESTRYSIYAVIHKALRAQMSHALMEVGRCDWHDASERAQALLTVEQLLQACGAHLQHENEFIHVAMEACQPGSAAHTATEHRGHQREIAELTALSRSIGQTPDRAARRRAGSRWKCRPAAPMRPGGRRPPWPWRCHARSSKPGGSACSACWPAC